jgi:hypothetical protein
MRHQISETQENRVIYLIGLVLEAAGLRIKLQLTVMESRPGHLPHNKVNNHLETQSMVIQLTQARQVKAIRRQSHRLTAAALQPKKLQVRIHTNNILGRRMRP